MNIITKFTIATDKGINMMMALSSELAKEKFSSILDQKILKEYIDKNYNKKQLVSDINDLSNQWLVVYVDNQPAGYAKITSRGEKPQSLENKRALKIADFAILTKYPQVEVKKSLLQKCLFIAKNYDGVWINEYVSNSLIDYFQNNRFIKQTENSQLDELALPSICLVYLNDVV